MACAAIALVVSSLAVGMLLSAADWNVTSIIRFAPQDPLVAVAQQLEPDLAFVPAGHYDGVYYYAIAIDPLARGEASDLIDLAAHRYGHPGYGWVTWLVSLGNPRWVPHALLLVGLAGFAAAAYFASRLSTHLGLTPWGGLAIALNPGLVFAVTTNTSEAITAGLLTVALLLWLRDRWIAGGVLLAILCFFKFQMTLVPLALIGWELIEFLRKRTNLQMIEKRIALLAAGPVLFVLWLVYVAQRFSELATSGAPEFLSLPFVGFLDTLRQLSPVGAMDPTQVQLASAQLPILVCLLALFVVGLARASHIDHPLDTVFLLQGGFVLLLNWWNLFYPKDMLRSLAIPVSLLIVVLALRRKSLGEEHATALQT